jgi:hypothetical protein
MTAHELAPQAELLLEILEDLTGQKPPLISKAPEDALALLHQEGRGLGYSQINELLLLLGYDRITLDFFQYLVDDSLEYRTGSAFHSLEQLQAGTERFRKLALLHFGNVKFAFKNLSQSPEMLQYYWLETKPRDVEELTSRHDPVQPLLPIAGGDTFYLGYIVQRDLKNRLAKDPNDPDAVAGEQKRAEIVSAGIRNHMAYLASDHLDVYIATSMREPHEYLLVNRLTGAIFDHPRLRELKLRWFDPTQARDGVRVNLSGHVWRPDAHQCLLELLPGGLNATAEVYTSPAGAGVVTSRRREQRWIGTASAATRIPTTWVPWREGPRNTSGRRPSSWSEPEIPTPSAGPSSGMPLP